MRLLTLDLIDIGPFGEAHLDFRVSPGSDEPDVVPVTIVTGENGTGKSIIIDAIREAFGRHFAEVERDIYRQGAQTSLRALFYNGEREIGLSSREWGPKARIKAHAAGSWVVDYWQSALDTDSYAISGLKPPEHRNFRVGSLQGHHRNADTTQLICHIDYLRDSRDPTEKRDGELLYQALEDIARASMVNGRFAHVARAHFQPMFEQRGELIGIEKLSGGSRYLLQRMLGLLGRMYSCHVVSDRQGENLLHIPGLLLIDEAENHLHPKWQKRFIPTIQELFPKLQIVVATHSPFIVASAKGARVFVCSSDGKRCTVEDVSSTYADRPIDEILMSPAFAETQPFSQEITDLLEQRKAAIEAGNEAERQRIETELLDRNPEYFDYFHLDTLLKEVAGGASS
jgi:hypothetical protein